MVSEASADLFALAQQLQQAGETAQDAVMKTIMQAATFIAATMKSLAPVDTGNLRDSIGIRMDGNSVIIGPDMSQAPYAGYVEFGTAPHEIRPKNVTALKFQSGGKTIYARVVHHPGTKAAYYVAGAFQQWAESLGPMVAETGAQLITGGPQA